MGMLLRYPYEVRDYADYFDGIQDVKVTKEMLDLARHIVEQKSAHFDPNKFEDRYETALSELLKTKQAGKPIRANKQEAPSNVVNLMDALRRSLGKSSAGPVVAADAKPKKTRARKAPAKRKAS
jgi:DNA end-binding protein Ku